MEGKHGGTMSVKRIFHPLLAGYYRGLVLAHLASHRERSNGPSAREALCVRFWFTRFVPQLNGLV